MADPEEAAPMPPAAPSTSIASLPIAHRLAFWGFAGLVVAGLVFYLWWGLAFGVWVDNGVYAVVVTLAGFGLAGMWLMLPNPSRPIPHRQ
ncbi:MAG TPA: hypothetical protein VGS23_00070 [Thermoplasmata archaeon]|nr:hypothetical protein [Thermoplasmata archaeon]